MIEIAKLKQTDFYSKTKSVLRAKMQNLIDIMVGFNGEF